MWHGGARALIFNEGKLLMIKQVHDGRTIWMVPGGTVEPEETSKEAARREVLEETGLEVKVGALLWHQEEVSQRGQRFVDFYLAEITGGKLVCGKDPELTEQVIKEAVFMSREEIKKLDNVYPQSLKDEIWEAAFDDIETRKKLRDPYRVR